MVEPKTDKQVSKEIKKLKTMLLTATPVSLFGDNNISAMTAQIFVLEARLTADGVGEKYEDAASNVFEAAAEAARWLSGNGILSRPSDEWKSITRGRRIKQNKGGVANAPS
jgi:hypothetical protein